jgi:UDP-N-acetylglucosamine/UDP-N-acetylgalactosamine diphosphorylase
LANRGKKTVIVEYSKIPPEDAANHKYGNSVMHKFTHGLIRGASEVDLPFHVAVKADQLLSAAGGVAKQEVHKFKWFILDALELSSQSIAIQVKSIEEFAPVKNAPGQPTERPETARDLLLAEHRRCPEDAGITLVGDGPNEFNPATSYADEFGQVWDGLSINVPAILIVN